jgi:hypothetical protein
MRRTSFPIKLYFLVATALMCALFAYLSRYETHLPIRGVFKLVGFGNASLVEHFTTGFAVPAAFVAIILFATSITNKPHFIKSKMRILAFVQFRRWLTTRVRPSYLTHWTGALACSYVLVSLQWEMGQVAAHGFFQTDQLCMDLGGAVAFCVSMWALLEKNRRRAKTNRSFSLA